MMLFNCSIKGIMPVIRRPSTGIDNDDEHDKEIIKKQAKMTKTKMLSNIVSLPIGSTIAVQCDDGGQ